MAKDEQGFDPDENYTLEDNPFWDGTEAAHLAWWRGQEQAVKQITKQLQLIVMGPESTEEMSYQVVKYHIKLAMDTCTEIILQDMFQRMDTEGFILDAIKNSPWEKEQVIAEESEWEYRLNKAKEEAAADELTKLWEEDYK